MWPPGAAKYPVFFFPTSIWPSNVPQVSCTQVVPRACQMIRIFRLVFFLASLTMGDVEKTEKSIVTVK